MNGRGQYGAPRMGQIVPERVTTVYVEPEKSTVSWILTSLAVGGALLWAQHQSQQIEQLYKKAGLPHQSFAGSLRQGARSSLHALAERVKPKRQGGS